MWFDVNSHSVEPNLRSNQRASIFSIVLTYNWIIATALIVCLLGILSLPTAPILLYRNAKFNYTYTVDFKTQPVYLFHVNSTQPHHIVDFNASLIDISFKTLSKLQITNGSDCPPPPSLMTQDKAAIYCITGTANVTIDEYG